jgi:hypothetical protein
MTYFDVLVLTALTFSVVETAYADGEPAGCPNPPVVLAVEFKRNDCQILGSIIIERYFGEKSSSPYATEFDQRKLVVAYGKTEAAVKAAAGAAAGSKDGLTKFLLLLLPMLNLIFKIGSSKVTKHQNWKISTREIQYGVQGDAKGFLLNCVTAIRSSKIETTIVEECFPLEENHRFTRTLDTVRRKY